MDNTPTKYEIVEKRWINRPMHSGYLEVSRQEMIATGPEDAQLAKARALAEMTATNDTDVFVYARGALALIVEAR